MVKEVSVRGLPNLHNLNEVCLSILSRYFSLLSCSESDGDNGTLVQYPWQIISDFDIFHLCVIGRYLCGEKKSWPIILLDEEM
jgi:hypothetical protein